MFAKKSHHSSWLKLSSVMLGGFLIGVSYKRYGKNLSHHFSNITRSMNFNGYTPPDEPEI